MAGKSRNEGLLLGLLAAGAAWYWFARPQNTPASAPGAAVAPESPSLLTKVATSVASLFTPLGVRINNPMDLREINPPIPWQGRSIDQSAGQGYTVFDTPADGIRAGTKNLLTQAQRLENAGRDATVAAIIEVYAPPFENPVTASGDYQRNVAAALGLSVDEVPDLTDPGTLSAMVGAIIVQEVGQSAYNQYLANGDIAAALSRL